MAGFEIKLLDNEPILLTTFNEDFSVKNDAPALIEKMKYVFDSASQPIYMLDDLLKMKISFSDLVAGLALATRGDTGVLRHRNVRKMVVVSTNEIIKLGSNALKQAQYGGITVDVYPSLDAALKGIRAELAEKHKQPVAVR